MALGGIRQGLSLCMIAGGVLVLPACAATDTSAGDEAASGTGGASTRGDAAATGGAASGGSGSARSGAPDAALPECGAETGGQFVGAYTVPVSDALAPYASFNVDQVSFCVRSGEASLDYDLPELLVGRSIGVSFRGPFDPVAGAYVLQGKDGTATCAPAADGWVCTETFKQGLVDLEAVGDQLTDLSPEEAAARRQVAQQFSIDPIGQIAFSPAP